MQIKVKKLNPWSKLPTRGSEYAAGYDLYADEDAEIGPGQTKLISTGIAVEIPEGYFGAIYARSGLATKQGLRPANCVGVIDSDYRGTVCVALHNDCRTEYKFDISYSEISEDYVWSLLDNFDKQVREVKKGDRIAQLVIQKFEPVVFEEVDELSDTARGEGGFGSTGEN